jgi:hypothetical protein
MRGSFRPAAANSLRPRDISESAACSHLRHTWHNGCGGQSLGDQHPCLSHGSNTALPALGELQHTAQPEQGRSRRQPTMEHAFINSRLHECLLSACFIRLTCQLLAAYLPGTAAQGCCCSGLPSERCQWSLSGGRHLQ